MRKAIHSNCESDFYIDTSEGNAGVCSAFHFHDFYEVYVLERGKREYLIDGKLYPVTEDTVILVQPGLFHETTGGAYRRKLIHFRKNFLTRYFSKEYVEELIFPFAVNAVTVTCEEKREIQDLFLEIEKHFHALEDEYCALCFAKLLSIVKNANKRQKYETETEGELIDKIVAYIEKHAFEKIELQQIADEFFISKYYLCHLFRAEKHMSIVDFLTKLRIEKASYLLATTDKKIKDVSAECGFNSEYYFSKRFHELTGLSPREYQKQCAIKI